MQTLPVSFQNHWLTLPKAERICIAYEKIIYYK